MVWFLSDFVKDIPLIQSSPPMAQRSSVLWFHPPSSPLIKVNFDGAIFKETGNARIGVIIRDSQGPVIESVTKKNLPPTF